MNSFKVCALNIGVDGSEDSKIHCFKKGETCEAGAEQLSVLDEPNFPNPFMEIDDSDTEEADEMNIIDNDSDVDNDIDGNKTLKAHLSGTETDINKQ